MAICNILLARHSLLKVDTDRNLGLTLMPWFQNRLVLQYTLKGGEVSGGVAKQVLCHLGPGHERCPLPWPVLAIELQKPAHILVNSLHLPITLRVKT